MDVCLRDRFLKKIYAYFDTETICKKKLWKNHSDVYICLAIDRLKKVSRWIGLSVYTKSKDSQVAYKHKVII